MSLLVCMVPVCPVRSEPSHRSEQTSQLLFGEVCELLERAEDFVRIRILYDNYEGWCQLAQLEEAVFELAEKNNRLAGEWINKINVHGEDMYVPFGSSLGVSDDEKDYFKKHDLMFEGTFIDPARNANNISLVKRYAFTFLNTPYLWGGRSVFGIDCSGFTQLVFKCINIPLLRDAYQQATQGKTIDSLEEAKCGDAAFFDNDAGKITHVGILLDSKTIIHASGKVRVDDMNDFGIINRHKRTHNLKMIKRFTEGID